MQCPGDEITIHPMGSLLKKIYTRCEDRVVSNIIVVPWIRNRMFKLPHLTVRPRTYDACVFTEVFFREVYDIPLALEPKFIIDTGANVGYASIFFANKYPSATIVAVEPEEENFRTMEKNTEQYPSITCRKEGVWHKDALLRVWNKDAGSWAFSLEEVEDEAQAEMKGVTITEIMKQAGVDRIDILKVDIEGGEQELFSENLDSWLPNVDVLLIELHERLREGCGDNFHAAMEQYGFTKIQEKEGREFIWRNKKYL